MAAIRASGGDALTVVADVIDETVIAALRRGPARLGPRRHPDQRRGRQRPGCEKRQPEHFRRPDGAFDEVMRLNLHGTVVPSLVFGRAMAERGSGCIVNISSMAATLSLTGVLGYSIAKAGIESMTRWLAMDLASRYGAGMRVNAIAPGFFLGNQNRALARQSGRQPHVARRTVIDRTPMGRFGKAEELIGPVHCFCSDAASFVTGAVVPVDGGFSVFSGV